jgi:hypothetical protein
LGIPGVGQEAIRTTVSFGRDANGNLRPVAGVRRTINNSEMTDVPDRRGWLNEPLASYPAVPPFPQLTNFERRALDVIAEGFGSDASEFKRQIDACRVVDRVNTIVGFYTRTVVDKAAARPLTITYKGAHFEVPGTRYGMMVLLWSDDGYLSTIEATTYGEDDMGGQDLVNLDFISFQLT